MDIQEDIFQTQVHYLTMNKFHRSASHPKPTSSSYNLSDLTNNLKYPKQLFAKNSFSTPKNYLITLLNLVIYQPRVYIISQVHAHSFFTKDFKKGVSKTLQKNCIKWHHLTKICASRRIISKALLTATADEKVLVSMKTF